jgi:hypothetical protein
MPMKRASAGRSSLRRPLPLESETCWLLLLGVLDLILTVVLLQTGTVREANPLARWILAADGVRGLVWQLWQRQRRSSPRGTRALAGGFCCWALRRSWLWLFMECGWPSVHRPDSLHRFRRERGVDKLRSKTDCLRLFSVPR